MGESFRRHDHQLQQHQHPPPSSAAGRTRQAGTSRLGLRNAGGEIVEVQGGHIVRSTGRKDRHSMVCTSKGPRDRRVRLSAHTAIQFFDVQDRLGYDRPSKAVDWLIKKAKSAIDELAELPAWHPTTTTGSISNTSFEQSQKNQVENHQTPLQNQYNLQHLCIDHSDDVAVGAISGPSGKRAMSMLGNESNLHQSDNAANQSGNSSSFMPPSLDSDSIADTIKSFFPMGAISAKANSSGIQFQSFPPPDLLSRTSSHSQDLRLSLQSFQDPILLHHHHHQSQQNHHHHADHTAEQARVQQQAQTLFSGASQLGFDASSGWSEHQQPSEIGRFQRMGGWNPGGDAAGGGYLFSSPASTQPLFLQQLFGGHNHQLFSQRGPLQSSNTPSVRAWMDPSTISIATADPTIQHHHHHQAVLPIYPSSISGIGFASGVCGFSGFRIPARIQGEEEEHDGISDKPSSASSDSRH